MIQLYAHTVLIVDQDGKPFREDLADDIANFVRTVCAYKGTHCLDVCVMTDHVHILIQYYEHTELNRVIDTLRCWLHDYILRRSSIDPFQWKEECWAVSKSPSCLESMRKYLRRQREYHVARTVMQEWEDMLDMEEIELEHS